MATTPHDQSPAAIERDIKQTQNAISDTVEELQHRLSPRSILNSLIGDEGDGSDQLVAAARRNPIAVGLIGAGALMLASGKSPSLPSYSSSSRRSEPEDPHHRSYLAHMNSVEHREGEPADAYRRRRDMARANYFMLEQGHDEDEPSFRQRLDDAASKLRDRTASFGDMISERAHGVAESASSATSSGTRAGKRAARRAQQTFQRNPLVGGLIAAAVGAVLGAVIPDTETEEEAFGDIGRDARSSARNLIGEGKDKVVEQAKATLNPDQNS